MKLIEEQIDDAIASIANTAHLFAGVYVIHDIRTSKVAWMSQTGLDYLGTTLENITKLTPEEYYYHYFNEEDAKDYAPKIWDLVEKKLPSGYCVFFQQVRPNREAEWAWFFSTTKILLFDEHQTPILSLTSAVKMENMQQLTVKASRILEENNFLKKNHHNFSKLTDREREILKHMALGKTAAESGGELFISFLTVETHRKNIRKKLKTNSSYDLNQYARSFDLI